MTDTPKDAARALERLAVTLPPAIDAQLTAAGEQIVNAIRTRIGQERPEWPPLTPATIAAKAHAGQLGRVSPTDPLLATGELRDSYSATVENGTLIVGSSDPVAAYHEHGTARMPPRPVLAPIAAELAQPIVRELGQTIAEAVAQALRSRK